MRMTEDQITRDMLAASASIYNCVSGNNGDLPTNLTGADIDNVTTMLLSNDAWTIMNSIEGEDRFGTGPTRTAYVALAHTDLVPTLNNINGFISQWNYPNKNAAVEGEWGAYNNARVLVSSVASLFIDRQYSQMLWHKTQLLGMFLHKFLALLTIFGSSICAVL